jgi:Ca-activated chloride channel family protein
LERIAPAPAAAPWAGEPDRRSGAILVSLAAPRPPDREVYPHFTGHSTLTVEQAPVSTFSIDVDNASYANVRRFLVGGRLPPPAAVRIEELVNYFDYGYPEPPTAEQPIGAELALFDAPWAAGRQLLRIGLQGHQPSHRRRVHLVFLVDVSGSMASPDKLPLLQQALRLLVRQLQPDDQVAIVTYANAARIALHPTRGSERARILAAIDGFVAGGRTAGAAGIQEAYRLAEAAFDPAALNRVVLATDGDFNVGIADPERLEAFIAGKRASGVYLSVAGFGRGNLNDLLMQRLAQAGNGNAGYIDSLLEAQKVLVDEIGATLLPVATDVKVQIEFNPARVAEYRLIGYQTRLLARPDFRHDRVDAGEIGSGQGVTALYEITPVDSGARLTDDLRYRARPAPVARAGTDEVAWLRIRYKLPGATTSEMIEAPVRAQARTSFDEAPESARFAVAVAGFGQLLRHDPEIGDFDFADVAMIAGTVRGDDRFGYRSEFLRLVRVADGLAAAGEIVN